jgi:YD repeat-containing protein
MKNFLFVLISLFALNIYADKNADKSGVSTNRLKLPKGPGSLEGVGENIDLDINMGLSKYAVPIALPEGYRGTTPKLAFNYNSGLGSSVLGLGWSLPITSIDRMTARGLPRYTAQDLFAASGEELVAVGGYYRARFEKSFVRYSFNGSRWLGEYPDGRKAYFGESSASRVWGSKGVFRCLLEKEVDTLGHEINYGYEKKCTNCEPVLTQIAWARYSAKLSYETRQDILSDGKSGVELRQDQRLVRIEVFNQQNLMWRYDVAYESYTDAFGLSRLASVQKVGRDGKTADPIKFSFNYSGATPNVLPQVVSLGSVGVDFSTGHADLIDINGDALPDVVDTTRGQHLFYMNTLQNGQHFSPPVKSRVAPNGSMDLASQYVEMADIDGDGHTDMIDVVNSQILWNKGTGDWSSRTTLPGTSSLRNLFDTGFINFTDYDGDKAIDLISTAANGDVFYYVGLNRGNSVIGDPLDSAFAHDVKFADMNGDGLQDVVRYVNGILVYKLSLGFGTWSPTHEMSDLPNYLDESDIHFADINGDALSDVVVLEGASDTTEIQIFINQNTTKFLLFPVRPDSASLPDLHNVSLRFADMNGNGTTDVVFVNSSGELSFLDLFGLRPNLLTAISNNIGMQSTFTYGSSVQHGVKNLPFPSITVDTVKTLAISTSTAKEQHLTFADGYYDGVEHQFRGYKNVSVWVLGDAHTQAGETRYVFDVGDVDIFRKGLLLEQSQYSSQKLIKKTINVYKACEINLPVSVKFECLMSSDTTQFEGSNQGITTRETYQYDLFGNQNAVSKLGSITAPGDEIHELTSFIPPGNGWLIRLPYRKETFGISGGISATKYFYYDGSAFVGLGIQEATAGLLTRTLEYVSDMPVDTERLQYDPHGNVTALLDANGHKRRFDYDPFGLLLMREWADLGTYALGMEVSYDGVLNLIASSSDWFLATSDDRNVTTYGYDALGRLKAITKPGDASPTETYDYLLTSPFSKLVKRARSNRDFDIEENICFDGLGRKRQILRKVRNGVYQSNGFVEANPLGKPAKTYQPFTSTTSDCAPSPKALFSETFYDALGRETKTQFPDASYSSNSYEPLLAYNFDPEDNASNSSYVNTPSRTRKDGLERVIEISRSLTPNQFETISLGYDELGRLNEMTGPTGYHKLQTHDLLGRVLSVQDDDTELTSFTYDAVGNVLTRTDARGSKTVFEYDAANRLLRKFDAAKRADTLVEYVYDTCIVAGCTNGTGRLVQTSYPIREGARATDTFGYDARGQKIYLARSIEGHTYEFNYTYNNAGRIIQTEYPMGKIIAAIRWLG